MIASYNREQKDRLVNAFICEFEAGGRREVLVLPIVPDGMVGRSFHSTCGCNERDECIGYKF